MADRELARIFDLVDEAYRAGLNGKAARIARQGADLASERRDHFWRVRFRFWEGECLNFTGDTEAATAALMEAARPEPEADPAHIYSAITTLIWIAINGKPAAFTRRLLMQGREHLARSGKPGWRHMLDLVEGHLAFARGDWPAALGHYRDGYDAKRRHRGYPGYTTATHLFKLAETAFALGDAAALDHWRRALDDCDKQHEGDHLDAEQARLLCHRAGRPGLGEPVAAARALLRRLAGYEGDQAEFARDALRVLLLHGHWPPVDEWLPRPGVGADWRFGGDVCLARARAALGLPARDADWAAPPDSAPAPDRVPDPAPNPAPDPAPDPAAAATHLAAARAHYESKRAWATAEDARLETDWYTATLTARLAQVADLVALAGAAD